MSYRYHTNTGVHTRNLIRINDFTFQGVGYIEYQWGSDVIWTGPIPHPPTTPKRPGYRPRMRHARVFQRLTGNITYKVPTSHDLCTIAFTVTYFSSFHVQWFTYFIHLLLQGLEHIKQRG